MTIKACFVGLGVMGYPMAGHLARGGFDVTVYNRTTARAQGWVDEYGGSYATTADFIQLSEEVSGLDLGGFFDSWLYADEVPPLPS